MNDESSEGVKKALQLGGDADRIKDYYRDWADNYDVDVSNEGYRAPDIIAALAGLVQLAYLGDGRTAVRIMDAGCGTGLTGISLKHAGFARIDGFDIAPEMVDAARLTQAYETLLAEIDLNEADAGLGDFDAVYDIVTCVGVFTLGHVDPSGFDHLIAMTKPGGFIVVSTRDAYLEESGFRAHLDRLEAGGRVTCLQHLGEAAYVGGDTADYWVYRKAEG